MVWGILLLLVVILLLNREGFQVAPGGNPATYDDVIRDFRTTIYQSNPRTPSYQEVVSYLSGLSIRSEDKQALVPILQSVFKTDSREQSQIKFTPDGTKIQPEMAAEEPIGSNAKYGDYETSDKDPVMPRSKVMEQTTPLNRNEVKPYSWKLAAYQQETFVSKKTPNVPKIPGTTEHMSTMAGGIAQANQIYGPRIPKQDIGASVTTTTVLAEDSGKMFPWVYGPRSPGFDNVDKNEGSGDGITGTELSAMAAPPYVSVPRMTVTSVKTEPVPFLNNFSKFFH